MDRAEAIYHQAVDLEPEERKRFLLQISSEDPELHQRVLVMFHQYQSDTEDLPTPAVRPPSENYQYIFGPADLIAGRYLVMRTIAKGGMGEVYEVEDRELHSRVALKVINLKSAAKPDAPEMFRREILLARQVTHPNVCRIYDIGHHDHPKHGDLLFLTMEFLRGQTLSDRIRTQGPLTKDEALPLLEQMTQALAAAHRLNIAHRDFKSANVILCETPDSTGPGELVLSPPPPSGTAASKLRGDSHDSGQQTSTVTVSVYPVVKVTDFGLARSVGGMESTAPAEIWGTPDYMAPEQFHGQSGISSDIYSLGVVIYEMFTGKLPRRNDGLKQTGTGLGAAMESVPAEWRPIVQRCRAYSAADRYPTVDEVWAALSGQKRRRTILGLGARAAAIVAVFLALFLGTVAWVGRTSIAKLFRPIPKQKHIAVLRFQNIGDDAANAAFCAGVGETLASKLSQLGQSDQFFWVVPFSDSRKYDDVEKARRNLDVNLVVTGSVQRAGNDVRITANLIDAKTHRQLASRVMTASVGDLNILQDQVWESVAKMVDLQVGADDKKRLQQGSTAKPGAYDYYEQGVGYLQSGDLTSVDRAIQAFEHSAAEDPNYALARAGLGIAYARKYDLTKDAEWITQATKSGNQAVALNPNLAPVREALGAVYEQTGKLDEAKAEYRRALELNPTSSTALVHLAKIYFLQGKYPEAEDTLKRVIALNPSYAVGHGQLGQLYYRLGRFKDAAAEFQKVVEGAPDNLNGYTNLGGTMEQMGQYQDAITVFKKGLSVGQNADTWTDLGAAYMFLGENAKAVEAMQKATELKPHDHRLWRNLGDSYRQVPTLAKRAPDTYRKALDLAEQELKVNPNDPGTLEGAALYNAHLGNKAQTQNYIKQALKVAPNDSEVLFTVALAYELIGDRREALNYVKRSVQAGFSVEDVKHEPELLALRTDPKYGTMIRTLPAR